MDKFIESGKALLKAASSGVKPLSKGEKSIAMVTASLEYINSLERLLPKQKIRRERLEQIVTLGKIINDWYDTGELDVDRYKKIRREICPEIKSDWTIFWKRIRNLERNRPSFDSEAGKIIRYREGVNKISLAFCCSVAMEKSISDFVNEDNEFSNHCPNWFKSFFYLTMAGQVVDDYIGRRGDITEKRPSFYTAYHFNNGKQSKITKKQMDVKYGKYMTRATKLQPRNFQLLVVSLKTIKHLAPPLFEITRRTKLGTKIFSERDTNER